MTAVGEAGAFGVALELCLEVYQDEGRPIPPSDADPDKTIKEVVPVKLARV